jgi:hypothetical protein
MKKYINNFIDDNIKKGSQKDLFKMKFLKIIYLFLSLL